MPVAAAPAALALEPLRTLYLGSLGGAHCFAAEAAADTPPPQGFGWHGLRALFSVLEDAHFALAGRALQLLEWDRTHQFCGRCGTPTVAKTTERSRECPACGLGAYPRVAPAIMVMIRRGPEEVLLARSPRFPPGMYSALAGFVEPGETLEQCLEREVLEEVGVRVENVRYFASQPWPFPHSLMIAFVADWKSGEISVDPLEIEAAQWFKIRRLAATSESDQHLTTADRRGGGGDEGQDPMTRAGRDGMRKGGFGPLGVPCSGARRWWGRCSHALARRYTASRVVSRRLGIYANWTDCTSLRICTAARGTRGT